MYVYWWHVRGLRAVKVGHAREPRQRVSDYRQEFGLGGKDVRGCKLGSGTDAGWVERQLCRMLETKGLRRIVMRSENAEEELFALGGRTFEDVHQILRDASRHIVFAEISNQRKQRQRREPAVAREPEPPEWKPQERKPETDPGREELHPRQQRPAAPPPRPVAARPWLYLIGAIVVSGLIAGSSGDDRAPGPGSASLTEPENPRIAAAPSDGDPAPGPRRDKPCTLVELSDTLMHVTCAGSWASMRWNGRWVLDGGHNESDALAFFQASDVARRVVAAPSREPLPELSKPMDIKPERPSAPDQAAAPAAPAVPPPPPQPLPQQTASPPATELSQPQPLPQPQAQPQPREARLPREHCHVSRPQPGYRVYLVTCPDSRAVIGRTVDAPTGWTVSESDNGTEAIDFFMKSKYAR